MTKKMKLVLWAAAVMLAAVKAQAAGSATLNIDVAITANLSVNVNGYASSTDTLQTWNTATPNAKLVGSSATVTNDSGAQTEKWALSTNATSIDQSTNGAWTLAASSTSVGDDQFSLQAVFGSSNTVSCPTSTSSDWDINTAKVLTASPVTYTSTTFADASLNASGGTPNPDVTAGGANGRMFASSKRALCWRVITPQSSSTLDNQNIQVIVTAQNP